MRFRLHGGNLHVHGCTQHPKGCDFFLDHTLPWMLGNREDAKDQLLVYRRSIVTRITALTVVLENIDRMLHRLADIKAAA
jgi:hypothetical protein